MESAPVRTSRPTNQNNGLPAAEDERGALGPPEFSAVNGTLSRPAALHGSECRQRAASRAGTWTGGIARRIRALSCSGSRSKPSPVTTNRMQPHAIPFA